MRALVVDDEPDIADSLCKILEKRGFEADAYYDPEKVLVEIQKKKQNMM